MPGTPLYPLTFDPIIRPLIWGGRRLGTVLHKPIGTDDHYAESWEISDHGSDVSRVHSGPLAGASLRELIRDRPRELLGEAPTARGQFPLLVKFLDANEPLSVQVHPNDELGWKLVNDNGKSETWVIVQAEPGSLIYAGLNAGVTREEFAKALKGGAVEPLLHRFEARRGDCIMIPAGTIHAIGAGVMLAEIQQMSDATFRVYDWGRVGPDGKPRQLHIDEALAATDFARGPVNPLKTQPEPTAFGSRETLSRCEYFALERWTLSGPAAIGREDRFTIVMVFEGAVDVCHGGVSTPIEFAQTVLLPASIGSCEVVPRGGRGATLLTCVVP
jgi:mannose-6-phosphate isomerase